MKPVHIRPARPFDAGPVARLLTRVAAPGTPAMTAGELLTWMADDTIWHLADQGGIVVGLQWVETQSDLPAATCKIATFVAPEDKHIGIGTRLFEATRKAARRAGFTHIHASIRTTNDGGLIYYQSRGFERLTPRDAPGSARPPVQNVTMTYRL